MKISEGRTEEGTGAGLSRILSKDLFLYFLDQEVKRARRYQNFISILLLKLAPSSSGDEERSFHTCYQTLMKVLMEEVRETDMLASLEENRLAVLLPYADVSAGDKAKSRFESTLGYYDFKSKGYEVKVFQISFPKNGTDTIDLITKALEEEPSSLRVRIAGIEDRI